MLWLENFLRCVPRSMAAAAELHNSRSDWLECPSTVLGRWKRRWIELTDEALLVYQDDPRGTLGKSASLLVLTIRTADIRNVVGPETEAHIITLQTYNGRTFKIKCYTKERAVDWRKDIKYRSQKKDK